VIVVDTSALVAIALEEPDWRLLETRLHEDADKLLSAVSYVEAGTVLALRRLDSPTDAVADLDRLVAAIGLRLVGVDEAQTRIAMEARIKFGKGFGARAGLNFGDSFSYALAKLRDAPLLFVGDDFTHTDITPALASNT